MTTRTRRIHLRPAWLSNELLAALLNELEALPDQEIEVEAEIDTAWRLARGTLRGRVGEDEAADIQRDAQLALDVVAAHQDARLQAAKEAQANPD